MVRDEGIDGGESGWGIVSAVEKFKAVDGSWYSQCKGKQWENPVSFEHMIK